MPGGICEKSRREELLKTKNEEHMSDWSFLFVSGRCCVSLVVSYLSFKVMPHIRTLLGASMAKAKTNRGRAKLNMARAEMNTTSAK